MKHTYRYVFAAKCPSDDDQEARELVSRYRKAVLENRTPDAGDAEYDEMIAAQKALVAALARDREQEAQPAPTEVDNIAGYDEWRKRTLAHNDGEGGYVGPMEAYRAGRRYQRSIDRAAQPAPDDDECDCGYGCPPGCGCRHSGEPTAQPPIRDQLAALAAQPAPTPYSARRTPQEVLAEAERMRAAQPAAQSCQDCGRAIKDGSVQCPRGRQCAVGRLSAQPAAQEPIPNDHCQKCGAAMYWQVAHRCAIEPAAQEPASSEFVCAACKAPLKEGYTCDACGSDEAEPRQEPSITTDYQPLYDFSKRHNVPFNELCAAFREALAPALASQPPSAQEPSTERPEPQGLTDAQIGDVLKSINFGYWTSVTTLVRAVEAALAARASAGKENTNG